MRDDETPIAVSDLSYGQEEVDAVVDVVKSQWLTMGPRTEEFERHLASYLEADNVIAVNSGTSALHLGLLSMGIGPGDEVITTPMTFVASANCILYTGATPVFADIDKNTFNIDPNLVEDNITPKTRAVLPVHLAGLPAEMDHLLEICERHDLAMLDDAAHAIGAEYKGKRIGGLESVTAFSFFSNKNLAVGEGGAITSNDDETAQRLRLMRSHGLTKPTWSRHHKKDEESLDQLYDMTELGFNYRITEIGAALGITQLSKLDSNNSRRREMYMLYRELVEDLPLEFQETPDYVKHSHHVLPVLLPHGTRSKVRAHLLERGVGTSIHYTPIHKFTYYRKLGYSDLYLPNSNEVGSRVVTLPLHQNITDNDVNRVITSLKESLRL
ncbi:MAG: DegT/DnrJ/EryC1/StrS family aminotransferase [Candidatus Thorarchaeota archaeon]